jgi:hypothetical protein
MTRPKIAIHDIATGVIEEREMNDQEFAQWELDCIESVKIQEEETKALEEQAAAKASALAKLTALGLTEEEAKAITG